MKYEATELSENDKLLTSGGRYPHPNADGEVLEVVEVEAFPWPTLPFFLFLPFPIVRCNM